MTCLVEAVQALASGRTTSAALTAIAMEPDDLGATERILPQAAREAEESDLRRAAGAARSELDGIPFAAKANLAVQGIPTSAGTALPVMAAEDDSWCVAALRRAGMVLVRTTTLAELALGAVTANAHTGPCLNPHDTSLNAGGSSGGSAALVAAGIVPVALGSDTLGSVRIPAAYCGIAALKPSRGAISTAGLTPLHPRLDSVGVLASSAASLHAVSSVLLGAPAAVDRDPMVIGVADLGDLADAEAQAALHVTLDALKRLGYPSRATSLRIDPTTVRRHGFLLCEADAYSRFERAVVTDDPGLSENVRAMLRYGGAASPERLAAAREALEAAERDILAAFEHVDVVVIPATPAGPPKNGIEPTDAADLTAWVNVAGLPAVVVPAGAPTREGMARGVQLVGRPGGDAGLLRLACALEAQGVTGGKR